MTNDLLKEQDLRTSTPQRWRSEQLMASTILASVKSLVCELSEKLPNATANR